MSQNRISPKAGWVDQSRLARGPNGRCLCRWCNQEVGKGRRTFCSDECVDQHKIRTNPGYVRQKVHDRDQGICAACGLDTDKLARIFRRLSSRIIYRRKHHESSPVRIEALKKAFPWIDFDLYGHHRRSLWQADHIVPVVEGGGECGLENYRTLCTPCHQKVTKELRARLREAKRKSN